MVRHKGFPGGAVLPDDKDLTEGSAIEKIPLPSSVQVVLDDGASGTAEVTVQPGQEVDQGQPIGLPHSEDGVCVHSSVSGTVREVAEVTLANGAQRRAAVIEADDQGRLFSTEHKEKD